MYTHMDSLLKNIYTHGYLLTKIETISVYYYNIKNNTVHILLSNNISCLQYNNNDYSCEQSQSKGTLCLFLKIIRYL